MPQPHNIIAVVFDYDKTLSPRYMQEDAIFKRFNIRSDEFWSRANVLVQTHHYESELAWMHLLLEHEGIARASNADLRTMGADIAFYPGLPAALPEMRVVLDDDRYRQSGIQLEFYVVTSGLRELVEGSVLRPHLRAVFGCEYDERDGRIWRPKRTVSHTAKTQMLFRISKNLISMGEDVNQHMPAEARRIPFENMIYVGDGPTDVPCFAVLKNYDGKSVAVYNPDDKKAFQTCYDLSVKSKRVDAMAAADYRAGSQLRLVLERMILEISDRIVERSK